MSSSFDADFESYEVEDLRKRINIQLSQIQNSGDLNFILNIIHNLSNVKNLIKSISFFSKWNL